MSSVWGAARLQRAPAQSLPAGRERAAGVVNHDGTITDDRTQLMWEKKVAFDGQPSAANLHDVDNCHPWSGTCASGGAVCGTDADCGGNGPCAVAQTASCQNASPTMTVFQWVAALNAADFVLANEIYLDLLG